MAVLPAPRDDAQKKTAHTSEQDRPDVRARRLIWFDGQPDLDPIEMAFSKLKVFLKKAAARTVDDLWDTIAKAIDSFTPGKCRKYFTATGYKPE